MTSAFNIARGDFSQLGANPMALQAAKSIAQSYDDLPLQCEKEERTFVDKDEIFIFEIESNENIVYLQDSLKPCTINSDTNNSQLAKSIESQKSRANLLFNTISQSSAGEPENDDNDIGIGAIGGIASLSQKSLNIDNNDNNDNNDLMNDNLMQSSHGQGRGHMESIKSAIEETKVEPLTYDRLTHLCAEIVPLNEDGKFECDAPSAAPIVALESALNQQLFCRGFKDRQPYGRVGNFALKLASVDKHHKVPTITNAWKYIERYKQNLYILESKKFEFNINEYNDSEQFWQSVFNYLIEIGKRENLDVSLALERGIYPKTETLFLNIKFPFLRDNNLDIVAPMIFDVSKQTQFGLNSSYILEFHDIPMCIEYLQHLWPLYKSKEMSSIDENTMTFEEYLEIQSQNTFEIHCIALAPNTKSLPRAQGPQLKKNFDTLAEISREEIGQIALQNETRKTKWGMNKQQGSSRLSGNVSNKSNHSHLSSYGYANANLHDASPLSGVNSSSLGALMSIRSSYRNTDDNIINNNNNNGGKNSYNNYNNIESGRSSNSNFFNNGDDNGGMFSTRSRHSNHNINDSLNSGNNNNNNNNNNIGGIGMPDNNISHNFNENDGMRSRERNGYTGSVTGMTGMSGLGFESRNDSAVSMSISPIASQGKADKADNNGDIEKANGQIQKLKQLLKQMNMDMANLKQRNEELEQEKNKAQDFLRERMQKLRKENDDLKEEIRELKEERNDSMNNEMLAQEIENLKHKNQVLENQKNQAMEKCKTLGKRLREMNRSNNTNTNDFTAMSSLYSDETGNMNNKKNLNSNDKNDNNNGSHFGQGYGSGYGLNDMNGVLLDEDEALRIALQNSQEMANNNNNNFGNDFGYHDEMDAKQMTLDDETPNNNNNNNNSNSNNNGNKSGKELFFCQQCSKYLGSKEQITFVNCQCDICDKCGYEYVSHQLNLKNTNIDCPICKISKISEHDIENVDKKALSSSDNKEDLSEKYKQLLSVPKTFDCAICFTNYPIEDVFLIQECKHELCRECGRNSIKADILNKHSLPRCPVCLAKDKPVETEITQLGVEMLMEGNDLQHYYNLTSRVGMKDIKTFSCPTPDCPNIVEIDEKDDRFVCIVCTFSSCVKCKARPFHIDETCEQYETRRTKQKTELQENEELFKKTAKENGWKPCPGCGSMQERTFGCFHMTCINPMCKTDYCDECGEKLDKTEWRKHFNVGKCKLWRSENDLLDPQITQPR